MKKTLFAPMWLLLVFTFCSTARATAQTDPDKIVYEFKDASIPPVYQRNYTITVTPTSASIIVTSDKELNNETVQLSKDQFRDIIKVINKAKLAKHSNGKDNGGCAGGTRHTIHLYKNNAPSFEGGVYRCGGQDYGQLKGNYKAVINKLKSLFPQLKGSLK